MTLTQDDLARIASVIAWTEGEDDLQVAARSPLYLDSAQQYAEDAGLA